MSRWSRFGLSVLFLLAVLLPARADLAPPFPGPRPLPRPGPGPFPGPIPAPAAQKAKLIVEVDNTIRVAKLQIPSKFLLPGGGAPAPAQPGRPGLQGADAGPRQLPTAVAGAALALTFTSGGFWLVRRRTGRAAVPFLVALLLLGIGGTVLWANGVFPGPRPNPNFPPPNFPPNFPPPGVRIPPAAPALPQLILPAHIKLDGNLMVEVVNGGDAIKLIVNKAMVIRTTGVKKPPAAGGGRRPIQVPRQPTPPQRPFPG
jgi:hypothetical protein